MDSSIYCYFWVELKQYVGVKRKSLLNRDYGKIISAVFGNKMLQSAHPYATFEQVIVSVKD